MQPEPQIQPPDKQKPRKVPERCLQEIFCDYFKCPPEEYEERLFWLCVRPNVVYLAKVFWIFYRRIFYGDLEMLRQLGRTSNTRELRYEIESFRHYHPPRGFIRRDLKVRVSGRRLLKIASKLFGIEASRRARSLRAAIPAQMPATQTNPQQESISTQSPDKLQSTQQPINDNSKPG
ncbi:MAG: hypothetical protein ACP5MG_00485 [Verrucomicrobiia bacterium]